MEQRIKLCPLDKGFENAKKLQEALDKGGDIIVEGPGYYRVSEILYIGDHTHLTFAEGVYIVRMPSVEGFNRYFISNKGIFEGKVNEDISITGLYLNANGVAHTDPTLQKDNGNILGARGHLMFSYVKDLTIKDIVIPDLCPADYGIQIANFENVLVENIRIEGDKDGIHFGPGKNFVVRHGVFRTHDDPVALNAFDYAGSNTNPGWIENGLIEDCYDLNDERDVGMCFFARMLCGVWQDWFEGMAVQQSDAAVLDGKLYRVRMKPSFEKFISTTPPTHEKGFAELDGITWIRTVDNTGYSAGCRNIRFKDIYIQRNRKCVFGFVQEVSEYCRSYFENSESPLQENIVFENVNVMGNVEMFSWINSPVDNVTLKDCKIKDTKIVFEPVYKEGLVYPENSKIYLDNTEVRDDFLVAYGKELSVEKIN